jgi:hypothetical protein
MARRPAQPPPARPGPGPEQPPGVAALGRKSFDAPGRRHVAGDIQTRLDAIWRSIRGKMVDAEVDVPDAYRVGTTPDAVYPTECYWRAYLYAQEHVATSGVWLVFGPAVLRLGSNAWVELPGGVVFDPTLQRFYRRATYYERQRARPAYQFTAEAAVRVFRELGRRLGRVTWLWDACLDLPPPSPTDPPVRIDLAEATRRLAAFAPRPRRRRAKAPPRPCDE